MNTHSGWGRGVLVQYLADHFIPTFCIFALCYENELQVRAITKLPNSEQSAKGKVKTHKYINRQNQSTTGKLLKP
jgi:hypothetical protein